MSVGSPPPKWFRTAGRHIFPCDENGRTEMDRIMDICCLLIIEATMMNNVAEYTKRAYFANNIEHYRGNHARCCIGNLFNVKCNKLKSLRLPLLISK